MLLTEIAAFVNLGVSNQISPEQMAIIMDAVQKNAFQRNQQAFLVYDQKLTILTELRYSASDLTSDDVDSIITGETSGATGTISAIYPDRGYITLSGVVGSFMAGETAICPLPFERTITVLNGNNFQIGWRGPYQAPTSPECRKIWGVTKRPPHLFWVQYLNRCGYWYAIDGIWQTQDYRAFWGDRLYPFVTGNTYDLENQFLFSYDPVPEIEETHPYYWVYWKNPPSITGLDDSTSLIIPEAYHFNFANACKLVAQVFLQDASSNIDKIVDDSLGGWINTLLAPFRSEWRGSNMTQAGPIGWI